METMELAKLALTPIVFYVKAFKSIRHDMKWGRGN